MTLEFTGTIDGDEIAGTVKLGEFAIPHSQVCAVSGAATPTVLIY
jgi:hypothetical protein